MPLSATQDMTKTPQSITKVDVEDIESSDIKLYLDMDLEELMDIEVSVSTKKALSIRETPGIVTLITRQEILNSGARDLLDVLTLFVPGVTFGMDVEGMVGISMRGIWIHEGKMLLMIDGQEMNEEAFSTTVYGNHYPVDNIAKIEVIRGPGSAIYGGYAESGVINIITRGAEENGSWISGLYSQMDKTYSHRNVAFGFGKQSEDLSVSLSAVAGQGMRSDRNIVDMVGDSRSMSDDSNLDIVNMNININYRGLDIRAIVDQYHAEQFDLWGENYGPGKLEEVFDGYFFNAKYDFKDVGGLNLTITPEFKYKLQYPWNLVVLDQEFTNEKHTEKIEYDLFSIWDITEHVNLVSGVEYYTNYLYMPDTPTEFEEMFQSGGDRIGYENFGAYAQLMWFHDIVNTTIGGRFDESDEYGSSFVPRIGFTKAWERFHAKAMYSQAFRVPGGNIPNSVPEGFPDIEPEKTDNYEVEVGCRIGEHMMLKVNAYDIKFKEAIVYLQNPDGTGSYYNSGEFGSRGVETECRYQNEHLSAMLNYAYYQVSENDVEIYAVLGQDDTFLGLPQHRLNALADIKISKKFSMHPSISFFGKRYGYAFIESEGDVGLEEFNSTYIVNLNFRARNAFNKEGLEIDFGVSDVFDSGYEFIQPYDGGHGPLPAQSRAIYVKAMYDF